MNTHKSKLSLNCGDQLLVFDFVDCFLFFPVRCGPIKFTSTYGLNIPVASCHFKSFAATTEKYNLLDNIVWNEVKFYVWNFEYKIDYCDCRCFIMHKRHNDLDEIYLWQWLFVRQFQDAWRDPLEYWLLQLSLPLCQQYLELY